MKKNKDINTETIVLERYTKASSNTEKELCCPVSYDSKYLEVIPQEILERDYGCGDPTKYIKEGETILDLGCGCGKNCYIASQIVGPKGKVLGIDFNTDMLLLAKKHQGEVVNKIGWNNIEFHLSKIQDLNLSNKPLIKSGSIDTIISNCVFNLVPHEEREKLFTEMIRVLKQGGKAAISDIVSDKEIPKNMKNDPELWSGCISGAFQENDFLGAFKKADFSNVEIVKYDKKPWKKINEIEFRSITIIAYKEKKSSTHEPFCRKST